MRVFFLILVYIILMILPISADNSSIDNTYFEYSKINIIHTDNIQNFTQTNSTETPSNTLMVWLNDTKIMFSATTNVSISNISYNSEIDAWNYSTNSSDAVLNVTAVLKTSGILYYLYINNTEIQSQLSDINKIISINYNVNSSGCILQECVTQLWNSTVNPIQRPNITSQGNNYTNNDSLNFNTERKSSINFNVTGNQTITNWNWLGSTYISGNGSTISASDVYFNNTGIIYVNVSGSNANGSTLNTVNWTVNVTDTLAPLQVIGLSNDTPTTTTVNVVWNANTEDDLWGYEIFRNGSHISYTKNAYFNDTGLTAKTLYQYMVHGNDTSNNWGINSSVWDIITANVTQNNTTPQITNITNQTCLIYSCTINFDVNQSNSLSQVRYGINGSMTLLTVNQSNGASRTDNLVELINNTKYYYSVWAWNVSNISLFTNSTIQNFTTSEIIQYIPPSPINISNISGNFWVNYTWAAGIGNITNKFNISINGTWVNNTNNTYYNSSTVPHGWINISVHSYNNTGIVNSTSISQNTQINNNPISITGGISSSYSLTSGNTLSILPSISDLDSDTATFSRNFTNGTFYVNNGTLYWITENGDIGTHYLQINVSDGHDSVDSYNFSVTINAVASSSGSGGGGGSPPVPTPAPTLTSTFVGSSSIIVPEFSEQFIPTTSPYFAKLPIELGIYSIEYTPNTCSQQISLNRTKGNISISSNCIFNILKINFIAPRNTEVYQLINNKWIRSEQNIVAYSADKKYSVIQVLPKSLGTFVFIEKQNISYYLDRYIQDNILKEIKESKEKILDIFNSIKKYVKFFHFNY